MCYPYVEVQNFVTYSTVKEHTIQNASGSHLYIHDLHSCILHSSCCTVFLCPMPYAVRVFRMAFLISVHYAVLLSFISILLSSRDKEDFDLWLCPSSHFEQLDAIKRHSHLLTQTFPSADITVWPHIELHYDVGFRAVTANYRILTAYS